jgi:hypothetical protein
MEQRLVHERWGDLEARMRRNRNRRNVRLIEKGPARINCYLPKEERTAEFSM